MHFLITLGSFEGDISSSYHTSVAVLLDLYVDFFFKLLNFLVSESVFKLFCVHTALFSASGEGLFSPRGENLGAPRDHLTLPFWSLRCSEISQAF